MKERRSSPRYPASWPVFIWLNDSCVLPGRTLDLSAHGMRIRLSSSGLSALLQPGQLVHVQVRLGETEGELARVGEVRHVTSSEIGLKIGEALPLEVMAPEALIPARGDRSA